MHDIPVENVRNFVIAGHSGTGKTALTDALAFKFGLNDRLGATANGSSISDFTEEEKSRKISIFSATFNTKYTAPDGKEYNLFFTDTPGFMDFYGQLRSACRAADSGVVTVDAGSGVQVGTRRAWKTFDQTGVVSRVVAVTGLDKDNTDFHKTIESLRHAFGDGCIPVAFPADDKASVVSVFADNVPAAYADAAAQAKELLMERAAESDDELTEKYLMEGSLSAEEIEAGLVQAAANGGFIPVVPVFPLTGVGIQEFLDVMVKWSANPMQRERTDIDGKVIDTSPTAPFFGLVWRSVSDSFVGQMSYVRILSGTINVDTEVENPSSGREKVASMLAPCGKKHNSVTTASVGDIVAIPKLKATKVSDTLCAVGSNLRARPVKFPDPVMFAAVTSASQADEDKLGPALQRLLEQDQTLQVERNAETRETVLKGLGDVHLDTAVNLLKQMSNVSVKLSTPKVAYRETVTAQGAGHHRHKKQSGGRGQYGEVYLKVEPLPEGDADWYVDETVGGSIPGNFIPAIEKGVVERMQNGAVAGYPVVNIKVRVYDGSFHDVDSSEIAFKIAGSYALRDGLSKARPVLLEPIMSVRISTPDQFMGAVTGDLTHKRGRVLGYENEDDMQVILAEVPQGELFRYAAELRSITGGQASFEMTFARYDVVPSNVAPKIIAESPYKQREAED
ncbi:MAG: elongation factor G [Kiritimatiellia bacterium]|jgi:elongation factor G